MVKMIQSPGGNDGRDPNDQRAYQAKMDELLLRERQAKIRQVRKIFIRQFFFALFCIKKFLIFF